SFSLCSPLSKGGWGVKEETGECYKLTYQPAPISAWILHPQSDNPNRQTLLNIIHSTLVLQPVDNPRTVS
ncbi:MAG: hypothetical protein AB1589_28530, partial [Cyanobacteriota bacterium]